MDDSIADGKPTASTRLAPRTKSGEDKVQSPAISARAKRPKAKVNDKPQTKKPRRNNKIARPCHFMRLPPELRLNIYEHHFRNTLDNIDYKVKQRKGSLLIILTRPVKEATMIKRALSLLHTNHIMRIEALPLCIQLAKTSQESMEAELDRLGSYWRLTPDQIAERFMAAIMNDVPIPRCEKLEMQHIDIGKIHRALRLVEWHVFEKDSGLGGEKKRRVELR